MATDLPEKLIEDFERGTLNRRQLASRLMGLGAAMAVGSTAVGARADEEQPQSTFTATGLDHVALDVSDIDRSRDFYVKHLGLEVLRESATSCFLGRGGRFFLTLFRRDPVGMNHYCYVIPDYDPDEVVRALEAAGLEPRRRNGRVYFDDPDGLVVQVTGP